MLENQLNGGYRIQECEYRFYDTPNTYGRAFIAIGAVPQELRENEKFDEGIFYYADTEEDFERLFVKDNWIDFYLIKEDN